MFQIGVGVQNVSEATIVINCQEHPPPQFLHFCWLNRADGFHLGPDNEETDAHVHPTKGHRANGNSGKLPGKVLKRVSLFNLR